MIRTKLMQSHYAGMVSHISAYIFFNKINSIVFFSKVNINSCYLSFIFNNLEQLLFYSIYSNLFHSNRKPNESEAVNQQHQYKTTRHLLKTLAVASGVIRKGYPRHS